MVGTARTDQDVGCGTLLFGSFGEFEIQVIVNLALVLYATGSATGGSKSREEDGRGVWIERRPRRRIGRDERVDFGSVDREVFTGKGVEMRDSRMRR